MYLKEWIKDALSFEYIKFTVLLNDNSEANQTAFEVELSNETNENKCSVIMQVTDHDVFVDDFYLIEILWGEDFESCETEDFLRYIIVDLFLTNPEA